MVKQTFLRDRVAALSNRIATVVNGQRLEIVERGRHFLKVKTEKNEVGWVEERAVIDEKVYEGFGDLRKSHEKDAVIATGALRDDLYIHLTPGRDTERFYLLPEGEKLQLLVRASVPKPQSTWGALPKPIATLPPLRRSKVTALAAKREAASGATRAPAPTKGGTPPATTTAEAAPIPMEDWWLIRSSQGKVGWLLARRLDVDVPDAIARYAEGQKIVGAYVLTTVEDSEATTPDKLVPEYVTVLNAYKDGLPYDFDQVRVFTWNTKKHRYETAYRQRNLQGYLPVEISKKTFDNVGPVPSFSFRQTVPDEVAIDLSTGAAKLPPTETLTYRMDGVSVKRVGPPGQPAFTNTRAKLNRSDRKPRHARKRRVAR